MMNDAIKANVDNLIDKMNQICQIQNEMELSVIDEFRNILVYRVETFLQYADTLKCQIEETGYKSKDGDALICFKYRGYVFRTFAFPQEYDQQKEKVLPPSKVTEPIQNNK